MTDVPALSGNYRTAFCRMHRLSKHDEFLWSIRLVIVFNYRRTSMNQCFVVGSASICLVKIESSELFILLDLAVWCVGKSLQHSECRTAAILGTKPARVFGSGSFLFQMSKTKRWSCQIPPLSWKSSQLQIQRKEKLRATGCKMDWSCAAEAKEVYGSDGTHFGSLVKVRCAECAYRFDIQRTWQALQAWQA